MELLSGVYLIKFNLAKVYHGDGTADIVTDRLDKMRRIGALIAFLNIRTGYKQCNLRSGRDLQIGMVNS
jgi:hypothetical protein